MAIELPPANHQADWVQRQNSALGCVILLFSLSALTCSGRPVDTKGAPEKNLPVTSGVSAAKPNHGHAGVHFVPNTGQFESHVRYFARLSDGSAEFDSGGVELSFARTTERRAGPSTLGTMAAAFATDHPPAPHRLRIAFDGATSGGAIASERPLGGRAQFYLGNDPARWRTDVPLFAKIEYRELFPGIALAYEGDQGHLKSTFTVAAGKSCDVIRWHYEGASGVHVEKNGDLAISLNAEGEASDDLLENAPRAWQVIGGREVPVRARYRLDGRGGVGFEVGAHDTAYPLVIDPTLLRSTDRFPMHESLGMFVDSNDLRYTAGRVWRDGSNFDAIVSVTTDDSEAPSNEIFFGGSGYDHVRSVAVDGSGNIFVAGKTESEDLPATAGRFQPKCGNGPIPPDGQTTRCMNAFVGKISSTDRHVWATYLGGKITEEAWSVGLDAAGNVYAAGFMGSSDFPLRNAAYSPRPHTDDPNPHVYRGYGTTDGFLTKLKPDGTDAIYSTALGGQLWNGGGMNVDPDGTATFVGTTGATNPYGPPLVAMQHHRLTGDLDATLVVLDPAGKLRQSAKFGGNADDGAVAVARDGDGNFYVVGTTQSSDFPATAPLVTQAPECALNNDPDCTGVNGFLTKIDSGVNRILYSTYLGGSNHDQAYALAVDKLGNAYFTGGTRSADLPNVGPFQTTLGGGCDLFLGRVDSAGRKLTTTYYGGASDEFGAAIVLSPHFPAVTHVLATRPRYGESFEIQIAWADELKVSEVIVNQGVDDVDIDGNGVPDLVLGRPAVARVGMHIPDDMPANTPIDLVLTFQGETVLPDPTFVAEGGLFPFDSPPSPTLPVTALQFRTHRFVDFYFTPQDTQSPAVLEVTIDPNNKLGASGSATSVKRTYEVKKVKTHKVQFRTVADDQGQALGSHEFDKAVQDSKAYIEAVYPIRELLVDPDSSSTPVPTDASCVTNDVNCYCKNLNFAAWTEAILSPDPPKKMLFISRASWFLRYRPKAVGFALAVGGSYGVCSEAGEGVVEAHELGHTFGLKDEYEHGTDGTITKPGIPTKGFWVSRRLRVDAAIGYMGVAGTPLDRWSTRDNYAELFRRFLESAVDPEVLLVTGASDPLGNVKLGPLYRKLDGLLSPATAGDAAVQIVDAAGSVGANTPFQQTIFDGESAPSDAMIFAVLVRYPRNGTHLEVVRGGKVLTRKLIATALLNAAIDALPVAAFVQDPAGGRAQLNGLVGALNTQLEANDVPGSLSTLSSLRQKVTDLLAQTYLTLNRLELSKDALFGLVDEVASRTSNPSPNPLPTPTITTGPSDPTADNTPDFSWSEPPIQSSNAPPVFDAPIRLTPTSTGQGAWSASQATGLSRPLVADGNQVWVAYAAAMPGDVGGSAWVAHSSDRGASFPDRWRASSTLGAGWVGLARSGSVTYATWRNPPGVYFAKKADSDAAFSPEVLVASNGQYTPSPAVDSHGMIYVLYADATGQQSGTTYVARSIDGGATFTSQVLGPGINGSLTVLPNDHVFVANSQSVWSSADGVTFVKQALPRPLGSTVNEVLVAADDAGKVYLGLLSWGYTSWPSSASYYQLASSVDEGVTFGPLVTLSTGGQYGGLTAGAAGRVYASWADFPTPVIHAVFSYSSDGAASFSPPLEFPTVGGVVTDAAYVVPAVDRTGKNDVYLQWYTTDRNTWGGINFVRSLPTAAAQLGFQWQLFPGTSQTGAPVFADETGLLSATMPTLSDGPYNFRVRASDHHGNVSDWTPPWKFTVDTSRPPGAPNNNSPEISGSPAMTIHLHDAPVSIDLGAWVHDAETDRRDLIYEIESDPEHGALRGSGRLLTYTIDPALQTAATDAFAFRVIDRGNPNDCGQTTATCDGPKRSEVRKVEIQILPVQVPGAPTDLKVTQNHDALDVSFGAAPNPEDDPIDQYRVQAFEGFGAAMPRSTDVKASEPHVAKVYSVRAPSTWFVSVSAHNKYGWGPAEEVAVQVVSDTPVTTDRTGGCDCRATEFGATSGESRQKYWLIGAGVAALIARRRFVRSNKRCLTADERS